MKCLEKLSLIDDDVVEDLKKDIEKLIDSYIDVEKVCLEIYDEIIDKIDDIDIRGICKTFASPEPWFKTGPIRITSFDDYLYVGELLQRNYEDREGDISCAFYNMFCNNNLENIKFGINGNIYWFYEDGTNWESWLLTDENFKKEVRFYITMLQKEDQLNTLKVLRELKERLDS